MKAIFINHNDFKNSTLIYENEFLKSIDLDSDYYEFDCLEIKDSCRKRFPKKEFEKMNKEFKLIYKDTYNHQIILKIKNHYNLLFLNLVRCQKNIILLPHKKKLYGYFCGMRIYTCNSHMNNPFYKTLIRASTPDYDPPEQNKPIKLSDDFKIIKEAN